MFKKDIQVRQHDSTDCAVACLASVAAYYGLKYPISRIRQYAYTDDKGTNALGLVEAAQKLGFDAKGVKGPFECLSDIPKPAIAHIVKEETLHHFVVIYKVTDDYIEVMDPEDGKLYKSKRENFRKEWSGILILLQPSEDFKEGNIKRSNIKTFVELLRPHRSVMLQALLGAILYSVLGLSTAIFVSKITDSVLVDGNIGLLNLMGIAMLAIILLRTVIGMIKSILALKTGQKIDSTLILGYYKHLLTLPQQFFDTMRVGEIISRVNDAVKIRTFINNVSLDLTVNLLILLFTLFLMFVYSWKLALIALVSAPLFILIYVLFNRLNKKYQRKIMESGADLESQLVESINGISTIKQFGVESHANNKTEARFGEMLKNTFRSIYGSIVANGSVEFISMGITVTILWAGSYLVVNQDLSPGTLMLFYALTGYILGPIGSLIDANQTIQDALIASDRLFQIMDLEREEADDSKKFVLKKEMINDICFENVSFRYGSRQEVFKSLNLSIDKGRTTAIVGGSGSGKTTLAALIQNIYPVNNGKITIGGYDISNINNESLRRLIGIVPQQIELFSGNIIENIALGDSNPDMTKINELSDLLGIRSFVEALPNSFMTQIGEHGFNLSGGERQRIAIARALYKDPEILILDEATSSLDSISERYVKEVLADLAKKGKTIIIIAHRLSTIRNSDKILVLQNGELVEEGVHGELFTRSGAYKALWKEQYEFI